MRSPLSTRQWKRLNITTPAWGSLDHIAKQHSSAHEKIAAVLIAVDEGTPLPNGVRRVPMTFAGLARRVLIVDNRWELFIAEAVSPGEDVLTHIGDINPPRLRR